MGVSWKSVGLNVHGAPALLDPRVATWWLLWIDRFRKDHPDIGVHIIQALGNAKASAGTHGDGWAIDLRTYHLSSSQINKLVAHLRHYGGVAWLRGAPKFAPHIHVAVDSGGIPTRCQYQVEQAHRGLNGLAGRGPDPHPAPARWVNYKQGIEMLLGNSSPDIPSEGDTMAISDADVDRIANRVFGLAVDEAGSFENVIARIDRYTTQTADKGLRKDTVIANATLETVLGHLFRNANAWAATFGSEGTAGDLLKRTLRKDTVVADATVETILGHVFKNANAWAATFGEKGTAGDILKRLDDEGLSKDTVIAGSTLETVLGHIFKNANAWEATFGERGSAGDILKNIQDRLTAIEAKLQ